MDPAFSLALGIVVFVLSYSCFGIGWTLSLFIALSTTIGMWIAQQANQHRKYSARHDFKRRCGEQADREQKVARSNCTALATK